MKDRRAGHPLNIAAALDVLKPIAWIALVSLVALASRAIGNDGLLLGGLWLALAIAAGSWALKQPWIVNTGRPIERRIGIALSVALIPVLTYTVALVSGIVLERLSSERYATARAALLLTRPVFPSLKGSPLSTTGHMLFCRLLRRVGTRTPLPCRTLFRRLCMWDLATAI